MQHIYLPIFGKQIKCSHLMPKGIFSASDGAKMNPSGLSRYVLITLLKRPVKGRPVLTQAFVGEEQGLT